MARSTIAKSCGALLGCDAATSFAPWKHGEEQWSGAMCQPKEMYEQWSKEDLCRAAQGGDSLALEELIWQTKDELYGYLMAAVRNRHDADDLLQETWCRAFVGLRTFDGNGQGFKPWLFKIARNTVTDHYRKERRHRHVSLGQVSDRPSAATESYRASITEEDIDRLPEELRNVFIRHLCDGASIREIATEMGIPIWQVYRRLTDAKTRLQAILRRRGLR